MASSGVDENEKFNENTPLGKYVTKLENREGGEDIISFIKRTAENTRSTILLSKHLLSIQSSNFQKSF